MGNNKLLMLSIMSGMVMLIMSCNMSNVWHGIAAMISAISFVALFEELVGGLDESNRRTMEKSERVS